MSLTYTSIVEAPVDEVFGWHTRPGAIIRLMPPWQPAWVAQEAESVRDGRAVLRLPGGLRWVAVHQPGGYDPPHQFVDKLAGSPLAALLCWRHTHRFAVAGGGTEVTDTVQTPVPAPALRKMFAYRHAQLAGDLASHARARAWSPGPVTVAVTGSRGMVGTAVTALLTTGGHQVIRLVRRPAYGPDQRHWEPGDPAPDLLAGWTR